MTFNPPRRAHGGVGSVILGLDIAECTRPHLTAAKVSGPLLNHLKKEKTFFFT
jgi:hypothetical protein